MDAKKSTNIEWRLIPTVVPPTKGLAWRRIRQIRNGHNQNRKEQQKREKPAKTVDFTEWTIRELRDEIYRNFRDHVTKFIRKSKQEFIAARLGSISDSSRLWKELANLGLVKSKNSSPFHFFSHDELNTFYASISSSHISLSLDDFRNALVGIPESDSSFKFSPITSEEVSMQLQAITSTSLKPGSDGISAFAIKKASCSITSYLTKLFNLSITNSYFPEKWKRAFIRPLLKIKMPLTTADTRPIANLPDLSKLFERLICSRIVNYLNSNNIYDPMQSGYRHSFSTQTALLKVVEDIRRSIDEGNLTVLVMFDFSKAFDMVPHLDLLRKLGALGFAHDSLKWIFSYLVGRTQSVVDDNGNKSSWIETTVGVPQGSVLGPLLFTLYIQDISKNIRYSHRMIFADDTQIYIHCKPSELNQAIAKITHDANVIADYASTNRLALNVKKSTALVFGSNAFVRRVDLGTLPQIVVNNSVLNFTTQTRNLGVHMQSDLSWRKHISSISQKVHSTLQKLKHHKNALTTDLRIKLVTTLVFPHIDYCSLIYHDCTDELNVKLQRLINYSIRFIYNLRRDEHITPYRKQLHWLSVKNRRLYFLGILTYRRLFLVVPDYVNELLPLADPAERRSARLSRNETFNIPIHRTAYYHNGFRLSAAYFWHSLPDEITSAPSLNIFKSKLHTYLLNAEFTI